MGQLRRILFIFLMLLYGCGESVKIKRPSPSTASNSSDDNVDEINDDEVSSKQSNPTNLDIGQQWLTTKYYKEYPHSSPLLPEGCTSFQATFYVAPNGRDSNNGSESSPYKTIQHALLQTDPSTCTLIRVAPGDYYKA